MKMRKTTDNQAQPANVSCKIVDKSHFLTKQRKNGSPWFRQSRENSMAELNSRDSLGVLS